MNRSEHFKGISTGVTDIDGDVIHEGDVLVPGPPKPLTGIEPTREGVPRGLRIPYKVIYNDGAFLLKNVTTGKRGKKRWRLSSVTVRLNGLKIQKQNINDDLQKT